MKALFMDALPLWLRMCYSICKQIIGKLALFLSYSPLLCLKIWKQKQNQGPMRWHLIYPRMPLCVDVCGCVSMWINLFTQPAHQLSPQNTHTPFWAEVRTQQTQSHSLEPGGGGHLFLAGPSPWQKKPMHTCSNRSPMIFSLPAFGCHKEYSVSLHLFYNSVSTILSLIAMINTHIHTCLSIPN